MLLTVPLSRRAGYHMHQEHVPAACCCSQGHQPGQAAQLSPEGRYNPEHNKDKPCASCSISCQGSNSFERPCLEQGGCSGSSNCSAQQVSLLATHCIIMLRGSGKLIMMPLLLLARAPLHLACIPYNVQCSSGRVCLKSCSGMRHLHFSFLSLVLAQTVLVAYMSQSCWI